MRALCAPIVMTGSACVGAFVRGWSDVCIVCAVLRMLGSVHEEKRRCKGQVRDRMGWLSGRAEDLWRLLQV